MKTVHSLDELWQARKALPGPVGLVPTMGFLHEGHLMLVKEAQKSCASVVVSIFVNPTQFGPSEDLAAYPRDLGRDLSLLQALDVDLVWTPSAEVMYPANYQTWIEVSDVTQPLEGSFRPGHFRGVTTVVAKLFNAIRPDMAVFGQKDAQQVAVISQMTRDLSYPIEIKVVPIVREGDGLALSSRNTYLDKDQRQAATVLYRALRAAEKAYLAGERSADTIRQIMAGTIEAEPLASAQYVSCADLLALTELETITSGALLSMAVYVGKTRLIDNWILE
jgi:pantoate--beta-alanine ligase